MIIAIHIDEQLRKPDGLEVHYWPDAHICEFVDRWQNGEVRIQRMKALDALAMMRAALAPNTTDDRINAAPTMDGTQP